MASPLPICSTAEERQARFWRTFDNETASPSNAELIKQAVTISQGYSNTEIPESILEYVKQQASCHTEDKSDFSCSALVRVYFLTDRADKLPQTQREAILSVFGSYPYWISFQNRGNGCYWTENHQILYLSSFFLLAHENNLSEQLHTFRNKSRGLLHYYLLMKLEGGFYEINSPVYITLTLTGLLNLLDFSSDQEIYELAEKVVTKLLRTVATCALSSGNLICATTRAFDRDLILDPTSPRTIQSVLYLIFDLPRNLAESDIPRSQSLQAATVASSNWVRTHADEFAHSWPTSCQVILPFGHGSISPSRSIKDIMDKNLAATEDVDQVMFNFSAGLFFHPKVAQKHVGVMTQLGLWSHSHFKDMNIVSQIPSFMVSMVSSTLDSLTKGHQYCQGNLTVFRDDDLCVSSLTDHVSGYLGYQKLPFVVNLGPYIIWLESGMYDPTSTKRCKTDKCRDACLPRVAQQGSSVCLSYGQSKQGAFFHRKLTGSTGEGVQLMSNTKDLPIVVEREGSSDFHPSFACSSGKASDTNVGVHLILRYNQWEMRIKAPEKTDVSTKEFASRAGVFAHLGSHLRDQEWQLSFQKQVAA